MTVLVGEARVAGGMDVEQQRGLDDPQRWWPRIGQYVVLTGLRAEHLAVARPQVTVEVPVGRVGKQMHLLGRQVLAPASGDLRDVLDSPESDPSTLVVADPFGVLRQGAGDARGELLLPCGDQRQ